MTDIAQLFGKDADSLLQHRCMTIPADQLYLPGHDYVDRVMVDNNRPPAVLRNMQTLYNTGGWAVPGISRFCRLTSMLNTWQAPPLQPIHSTLIRRTLLSWRLKRAVTVWPLPMACWRLLPTALCPLRIPFLVKLNHNETLSYQPNMTRPFYASVEQAFNMGAVAVGATIHFGSEQSCRQIEEISAALNAHMSSDGDRAVGAVCVTPRLKRR